MNKIAYWEGFNEMLDKRADNQSRYNIMGAPSTALDFSKGYTPAPYGTYGPHISTGGNSHFTLSNKKGLDTLSLSNVYSQLPKPPEYEPSTRKPPPATKLPAPATKLPAPATKLPAPATKLPARMAPKPAPKQQTMQNVKSAPPQPTTTGLGYMDTRARQLGQQSTALFRQGNNQAAAGQDPSQAVAQGAQLGKTQAALKQQYIRQYGSREGQMRYNLAMAGQAYKPPPERTSSGIAKSTVGQRTTPGNPNTFVGTSSQSVNPQLLKQRMIQGLGTRHLLWDASPKGRARNFSRALDTNPNAVYK